MGSAVRSEILLCAEQEAAVHDMRRLLEQAGHRVRFQSSKTPELVDVAPDLVVIEGSENEDQALQVCGRLRSQFGDSRVPILFVAGAQSRVARTASLEIGADSCLARPWVTGELLAQVQALLRLKKEMDRLNAKCTEFHQVHQRLQQAYQDIDQELLLARRVQQSLLPHVLPDVPPVRFAVHYRPCGRVGGDFYDAFRLDETHVGFYVADVMGHGVPAGLLTMFLKKAVKPKEITGQTYRLIPPEKVLHQLNREMIDQALAENPFITMVYGLLDCRTATLQFARAGHPYPLYLPSKGKPELWQVHGSLLGVFETQFSRETHQLRPGDKVLLYTDGLDSNGEPGKGQYSERLMACAVRHRHLPIDQFVAQMSRDLLHGTTPADDFTLLGLEIGQ